LSQPWRYSLRVRGREVDVPEGEVTVGRSRTASISLQDPSISRVHIRVVARDGRVLLEDLGSINGTYVNGLRIEGVVEIGDGAHIMLGESELELQVQKAPSPLATRRIDTREYICSSCKRPFPEGTQVCPDCDAKPEVDSSTADELPRVAAVASALTPLELPPLPPAARGEAAPSRSAAPGPRPAAPGVRPLPRAPGRKPGLLSRLFGRG
jgi:predicted component of type VI protein secretion system